MAFTIYCHTHRESQKRYVGVTVQSPSLRWAQHVYAAKSGRNNHFGAAIRQHGVSAFEHDILEVLPDVDEANDAERWWIAHFGSNDKRLGYNIEGGGYARGKAPPETCERMRAKWTPERKRALGDRRRGAANTEASKRRASETKRAQWTALTPEQRLIKTAGARAATGSLGVRTKISLAHKRLHAERLAAGTLPLFPSLER